MKPKPMAPPMLILMVCGGLEVPDMVLVLRRLLGGVGEGQMGGGERGGPVLPLTSGPGGSK